MRKLTRGDIFLAAGLIMLSLTMIALAFVRPAGGEAEVIIDNRPAGVIDLTREGLYTYQGVLSPVAVEVKAKSVRIIESGCPLKLCVNRGFISRVGESIICLPNRLMIVVVSGETSPVHGVTG